MISVPDRASWPGTGSCTDKERIMGKCIKGKSEDPPIKGAYQCHKCGAVSKKKDHLCKPDRLQGEDLKNTGDKEKEIPQ
jgi:hypothetical protein